MPAFVVIDVDVKDAARYEDYKRAAQASVAKHGGRFIVRGGKLTVLEGAWAPPRLVVLEFTDRAAAERWYASEDYKAAKRTREGIAEFRGVLVDGM